MRSYLSIFLGVFLFLQIVCSTPTPSGGGGSPFDEEDNEDEKPSIPGIGGAMPPIPPATGIGGSMTASATKDSGKGIGDDAKGSVTASVEIGNGKGKGTTVLSVSLGNTQNAMVAAIANSSACPAMTVIFARGTFEPG